MVLTGHCRFRGLAGRRKAPGDCELRLISLWCFSGITLTAVENRPVEGEGDLGKARWFLGWVVDVVSFLTTREENARFSDESDLYGENHR